MSSTPSPRNTTGADDFPDYTLIGPDGPIRLVDVFDGRSQLIVYNHMWFDGEEWQCGGCTSLTSQYVRLGTLDNYDARFVIVTNGPINEARARVQGQGRQQDGLVLVLRELVQCRRRCAAGRGVRGERVPPRRRHGVPHLAHRRPRYRTAELHVRADRHLAVGPPGGMAGLTRRLAADRPPTPSGSTLPMSPGSTARTGSREVGVTSTRTCAQRSSADQRLEPVLRSARRVRQVEHISVAAHSGAFLSDRLDESWVSAFARHAHRDRVRSTGPRSHRGHVAAMSYEQFVDDARGIAAALQVERADVMGYSQGGGVALQLAFRHPTLVNSWSHCRPPTAGRLVSVGVEGDRGPRREDVRRYASRAAFKEHTP